MVVNWTVKLIHPLWAEFWLVVGEVHVNNENQDAQLHLRPPDFVFETETIQRLNRLQGILRETERDHLKNEHAEEDVNPDSY
jgi:hypothetical protein